MGQPGSRTAQGCVQAHTGSTGRHAGSTQLMQCKTKSANLQKIMSRFIITRLSQSVTAPPNMVNSFDSKSTNRPFFYEVTTLKHDCAALIISLLESKNPLN